MAINRHKVEFTLNQLIVVREALIKERDSIAAVICGWDTVDMSEEKQDVRRRLHDLTDAIAAL
jgi:hypothetical protein